MSWTHSGDVDGLVVPASLVLVIVVGWVVVVDTCVHVVRVVVVTGTVVVVVRMAPTEVVVEVVVVVDVVVVVLVVVVVVVVVEVEVPGATTGMTITTTQSAAKSKMLITMTTVVQELAREWVEARNSLSCPVRGVRLSGANPGGSGMWNFVLS